MKLFDLFSAVGMPLDASSVNKVEQRSSSENSGFEQILNAAEQREEVRYKPKDNKPVKPKDKHMNKAPEEKPSTELEERNKLPEKEKLSAAKKTEKVEEKTAVKKEDKPAAKTEAEEEVIAEIADILQISPEALAQVLTDLNMNISDLADPNNVVTLLQVVLKADSPASLLSMPQFSEMFKAVNEKMEGFASVLEQALNQEAVQPQNKANANVLENMEVTTGENGETEVTFVTEKTAALQTDTATVETDLGLETDAEAQPIEAIPRTQTATSQNNTAGSGAQSGGSQLNQQNAAVLKQAEQQELTINTALNQNTETPTVSATAGTAKSAAAGSVVDANDVMNQIMSRIRTSGESFTEVRMTLRPDNLGDISLRVSTQNGIVTAQFVAENQRVKEIIEANFNQLRDVLNEQGINFTALNVSVRQDGQNERMAQFERGRQNSRARAGRITELGIDGEEPDELDAEELLNNGNINVRV